MAREIVYDDGDHKNANEIIGEGDDSYTILMVDEENDVEREQTVQKEWVKSDRYPYELA